MNGWWGVVLGVVLSLLANELCDVSPWLAKRTIPLAVRMWTRDADLREVYNEEWQRVVRDAPGKLTKLVVALWFLVGGSQRAAMRRSSEVLTQVVDRYRRMRSSELAFWLKVSPPPIFSITLWATSNQLFYLLAAAAMLLLYGVAYILGRRAGRRQAQR